MQEVLNDAGEPLPPGVDAELERVLAQLEEQYQEDFAE